MNKPYKFTKKAILVAIALAASVGQVASAASFAFELDFEFSGGTKPPGATPYITATFDDTASGTAGVIRLTILANNLSGSGKVGGFYFNLDPSLHAADLSFSIVSNPTGLTLSDINRGVNEFKADGDGYFDVRLDFPTSQKGNPFITGEVFIFDVSRVGGLTLENFIHGSSPTNADGVGDSPNGTFYAAAHVQSIAPSGDSGWVGQKLTTPVRIVPEPSSMAFAGLTIVAACFRRRRGPIAQPG